MQIHTSPTFIVKPSNGGYTLDGKDLVRISSVPKILDKPAVVQWAVNMSVSHLEEQPLDFAGARKAHANYFNERARYGTNVHFTLEKWAEKCIRENGGTPIAPDEIDPFSVVWQTYNYMAKRNLRIVAVEVPVYDADTLVGGRFDLLYEVVDSRVDDRRVYGVLDFKNYKGFYNRAVQMQLGKYADCVRKLSGEKVVECVALRFSQGMPVEIMHMDTIDIDKSIRAFDVSLELIRFGALDRFADGKWVQNT